jgi:hypothetical protein
VTSSRARICRQSAHVHRLRACQRFSGLPPATLETIAQLNPLQFEALLRRNPGDP